MTQQELERVKDWEQQVMRQCIPRVPGHTPLLSSAQGFRLTWLPLRYSKASFGAMFVNFLRDTLWAY